jgi:tetratricopeptide (TPR) repeat protein
MKIRDMILSMCLVSISLALFSQEVKELKQIESGAEFWEINEKSDPLIESDTNAAILIFEEAINKTDNSFLKYALMSNLGELYIATKQFDKCLDSYENLINSGVSVFFEIRGNTYPGYTKSLENNERFVSLLKRNNELVDKANENSSAEYFIQKPINYNGNIAYPLMMIFHGGIGIIQAQQHYWKAEKLNEDYIVVFVQGRHFLCTGKRRFGNEGIADVKNIYQKIQNDYLIDTTKVLLGGPSAGGMLAIDLAINNHIPAQGLVLAFPVKPREFGADDIYNAGINGLKVSMICGENDWALERQKEMSVIFDKLSVANRIVIYPENGHEYPDDFSDQILKSIEFIFGN